MVQKTSNAEITLLGPDRITLRDTVFEVTRYSALLFGVPHSTSRASRSGPPQPGTSHCRDYPGSELPPRLNR